MAKTKTKKPYTITDKSEEIHLRAVFRDEESSNNITVVERVFEGGDYDFRILEGTPDDYTESFILTIEQVQALHEMLGRVLKLRGAK